MSGGTDVVLAALPRELRPLVRALRLRPASLSGLPAWSAEGVVVAAVGVGPARARSGTAQVLGEVQARRVIVTGLAGALDPALHVGDLVRPAAVLDVQSGAVRMPCTPCTSGSRSGLLVTVPRVRLARTASEGPQDARIPPEATAVDMETAAIAAVCDAEGVPWDVVRAISDVEGTLTPAISALLRPDGRADVVTAVRTGLRDPRTFLRLLRLGVDATRAVRVATATTISELSAEGTRLPGELDGTG
ncbi:MAG: hypothetical protein ACRDXC_13875 [Acidimicrobiales bacterium]